MAFNKEINRGLNARGVCVASDGSSETHDIGAEGIQTCEHDTEASRNVELGCPECGNEFLADLAY